VPFRNFIYRDKYSAVYKTCTATAPARNKNYTRTAKSTPYLSCHRDYFPAKAPGHVAGWLRQVTQPPFIAGPLGVKTLAHNKFSLIEIYLEIKFSSTYQDFAI